MAAPRASSPSKGTIACETIVICAGQWSKEIGRKAGILIPLQSVEHQYLITEPCGAPRNLPTLRDPDRLIYYKEEVGGLVMGGYEPNPIPWALDGIPEGFHFTLARFALRPFRADHGAGAGAHAGAGDRRHQDA